jgi:hypothetical protein
MTVKGTRQGAVRKEFERLALIETDECIVWPFGREHGYASLAMDGKQRRLAVVVLERRVGPRPAGMLACHAPVICHDRACINYRHLRWATFTENALDRALDDTNRLSVDDVKAIRAAGSRGEHRKALAERYGVHWSHIYRIIAGDGRRFVD